MITYKTRHFYDTVTKERLEIKEGTEFSITCSGNDDFFAASPAGNYMVVGLNGAELLKQLKSDINISSYIKRYDKGEKLYFSISRFMDEKLIHHEFEILLLEDLYIYLKTNWQKQDYRLYDCACKVNANTSKTIDFFEPVYAKSLNELYKNTFVHYFGNKGNPACNALDRFYEKEGQPEKTIGKLRTVLKRANELKKKLKEL